MGSVGTITSRAAAITIFIVHGTKHRTIDPGCLENPRPEGAEPGERCFSIFFSSPNNLFLRKAVGYSAFTCTSKYPIPPSQRQNMWKTRRKNRKECEKVPAIFVRKSTENFVTRYTQRFLRLAFGQKLLQHDCSLAKLQPTPANLPISLVMILTIRLIWNPPALHFEPKPVHIESQRRFHVAHGEKRHRLLYIRARHGFDRHRSPPSASRLIMKWKLWRCKISMSLIDFTEVSIGASPSLPATDRKNAAEPLLARVREAWERMT